MYQLHSVPSTLVHLPHATLTLIRLALIALLPPQHNTPPPPPPFFLPNVDSCVTALGERLKKALGLAVGGGWVGLGIDCFCH